MKATPYAFDAVFRVDPSTNDVEEQQISIEDAMAREATAFARGESSAVAREAAAQSLALQQAAQALEHLLGAMGRETSSFRRLAADAALAAAEAASGRLVALHGAALVLDTLEECLAAVPDAPEIELRIAPDMADTITPQLEDAARASGFEGRLKIVGDETIQGADCKFAWDGGALERSRAEIFEDVAGIIDRHLSAMEEAAQLDLFGAQ